MSVCRLHKGTDSNISFLRRPSSINDLFARLLHPTHVFSRSTNISISHGNITPSPHCLRDMSKNPNLAKESSAISTSMENGDKSNNWPTVQEMESVLNCVYCNRTTSYPFMQCGEGHLICEEEGLQLENCPALKPIPEIGSCGAPLFRLRLRWFKWITERAFYECPIKDCAGILLGQKDRRHHIERNHPKTDSSSSDDLEELGKLFQLTNLNSLRAKGPSPAESLNDAEVRRIFENGSPTSLDERSGDLDTIYSENRPLRQSPNVVAGSAWIPQKKSSEGVAVVEEFIRPTSRGFVYEDFSEYKYPLLRPKFADEAAAAANHGMSFTPEDFSLLEIQNGFECDKWSPVVQQYISAELSPRKGINKEQKFLEQNLEGKVGDNFRLSEEDEGMYFKNKCLIDQEPRSWLEVFRANRTSIPLNAVFRELGIIKALSNAGKSYRDGDQDFGISHIIRNGWDGGNFF